jgi:hypothetical protein
MMRGWSWSATAAAPVLALGAGWQGRLPRGAQPIAGAAPELERSSAYLDRPRRTLSQACRDIAGCAGDPAPSCTSCRLADLCPARRVS